MPDFEDVVASLKMTPAQRKRKEWKHVAYGLRADGTLGFMTQPEFMQLAMGALAAQTRSCTCHPDDNPPVPCARKYALTECRAAARDPMKAMG